jgi:solute carrier family 38 (sodium-coupled neutral amino acid transporter), member 11
MEEHAQYSGGVIHRPTANTSCENNVLGTVVGREEDHGPPVTGGSKPKKKSDIFGASSNLVNSIVGAGIIGMPYAMKQSGLIAGTLLLLLVGWMTGE